MPPTTLNSEEPVFFYEAMAGSREGVARLCCCGLSGRGKVRM